MRTPLDRAMESKNLFLGFAGLISAAAIWVISGDSTPQPFEPEPTEDVEGWTHEQLVQWLRVRSLFPNEAMTTTELRERVRVNMR